MYDYAATLAFGKPYRPALFSSVYYHRSHRNGVLFSRDQFLPAKYGALREVLSRPQMTGDTLARWLRENHADVDVPYLRKLINLFKIPEAKWINYWEEQTTNGDPDAPLYIIVAKEQLGIVLRPGDARDNDGLLHAATVAAS
jgi:hypothetical protein